MTPQETKRYVERRLQELDWGPDPFVITPQAWGLIYSSTRGAPDTVDQLCNRLVSLGRPGGNYRITRDAVKIAVRELKLFRQMSPLPVPEELVASREQEDDGADIDTLSIEQLAAQLEAKARNAPSGEPTTDVPAPKKQTEATSGKPLVLVVDDSPTVRTVINAALEEHFECVEAKDGERGWKMLVSDTRIAMAIVDLEMPALDGYGLIRRIRAAHITRIATIPIIVVTAATDTIAKQEAFVAGADDFITKASDPLELLVRVRTHYELSQTKLALELERQSSRNRGPAQEEEIHSLDGPSADFRLSSPSVQGNASQRDGGSSVQPHSANATGRSEPLPASSRTRVSRRASWFSWMLRPIQPITAMTVVATALVLVAVGYIINERSLQSELVSHTDTEATTAVEAMTPVANLTESDKPSEELASASGQAESPRLPSEGEAVATDVPFEAAMPSQPDESVATSATLTTPFEESSSPSTTALNQSRLPVALQGGPPTVQEKRSAEMGNRNEQEPSSPSTQAAAAGKSMGPQSERAAPRRSAGLETDAGQKLLLRNSVRAEDKAETTQSSLQKNASTEVPPRPINQASDVELKRTTPTPPQAPQTQPARAVAGVDSPASASTKRDDIVPPTAPAATITEARPPDPFFPRPPSPSAVDERYSGIAQARPRPSLALTQTELGAMLDAFIRTYERGDLDRFIGLFAKEARTNERSSRDEIRKDYARLFQNTDTRRMTLEDVTWEIKDNKALGWTNFDVRVQRKGESNPQSYTGSLAFQVERNGPEVRITRLYHSQEKVAGKRR